MESLETSDFMGAPGRITRDAVIVAVGDNTRFVRTQTIEWQTQSPELKSLLTEKQKISPS
jgi:hypothetical protein